jgi:exportin-5
MFSEPATWNNGSEESKAILSRILKDRFWQVGISSGSRDEFYSRVEQSKSSLEGLASAIRGTLRVVRDKSYRLLSSTALLGDTIFRYEGLPNVMAKAIFEHSEALSTHQTGQIIEMMRPIIELCPPDAREYFLTPLLIAMFESLDRKISSEWATIEQNKAASENDDLQEEMKSESILRQLTYNSVMLVVRILDPHEGKIMK